MDLFRSLRKRKRTSSRQSDLKMLQDRKIVLTGDFFPLDKRVFELKLNRLKAEVQAELTSETDVLICGKFPDLDLIMKAENTGIYTIYIDKVSDIFSLSRWRMEGSFHKDLDISRFPDFGE